jgi:hypothetical protein
MKGVNTLNLNVSTVIAALQMWVDAQFAEGKAPKVASIRYDTLKMPNMCELTLEETEVKE